MENDILKINLNDIVSKEISEKIGEFELENSRLQEELHSIAKAKRDTEFQLACLKKDTETINTVLSIIRSNFLKIECKPESDKSWATSVYQEKFLFIQKIMTDVIGVQQSYEVRNDSSNRRIYYNLGLMFYNDRETLVNLIKVLTDELNNGSLQEILDYKLPIDFSKEQIMAYVKSPHYNTNGVFSEISWGSRPHDQYMKNPHILDPDVFKEVLLTISKGLGQSHYLYQLPKFANLTHEMIAEMGEIICLKFVNAGKLIGEATAGFIEKNILKFNEKTLDHLFQFIRSDNQFKTLDWQKFPVKYQQKFLMNKTFQEISAILFNYSCKWSHEEKDEFFKNYYSQK